MPLPENDLQYVIYAIAVIAVAFHVPAVKRVASAIVAKIISNKSREPSDPSNPQG